MCENTNEFLINIGTVDEPGSISANFKFTDKGLTHDQDNRFRMLPYIANENNIVVDFTGVVGAFMRLACGKKLKPEFDKKILMSKLIGKIDFNNNFENEKAFEKIIESLFIDNNTLSIFSIKAMNYIKSTSFDEKIAFFLFSMFSDSELSTKIKQRCDSKDKNVIYRLLFDTLPPLIDLNDEDKKKTPYHCSIPKIKELFVQDMRYILQDEEVFISSIKRLLEYYYIFYISQLAIKMSKFNKAETNDIERIFYTLSWEITSSSRKSYIYGWNYLKVSIDHLFSHAITLELINNNNTGKQMNYIQFYKYFDDEKNSGRGVEQFINLRNIYCSHLLDINWEGFDDENVKKSEQKDFNELMTLYEAIDYQFAHSRTRNRAFLAYSRWFVKYFQSNFGKRRGSLGYNLNLTEEDILLFTRIVIGNADGRIRLNTLFTEFEGRGLLFDRESKGKIIELFEKLNLLEKKSDSGDAQYVRSIL